VVAGNFPRIPPHGRSSDKVAKLNLRRLREKGRKMEMKGEMLSLGFSISAAGLAVSVDDDCVHALAATHDIIRV